jgi:hypothetical protein
MPSATGSSATSLQISAPSYTFAPGGEAVVYGPRPISPRWLAAIQSCIRNSVVPAERIMTNDGRWVSQEVADAASQFFQTTADLLPAEPILYASRKGDLVAEFNAEHGVMTSIISPSFVLLYAVVGGSPIERRVFPGNELRSEIQHILRALRTEAHGSLEPSR